MGRVLAVGVFDIFQPGHLAYLESSAMLGDDLTVLVARDDAVTPSPIVPEDSRVLVVDSFRHVDSAVLQPDGDVSRVLNEIDPAIIALEDAHDADHNRISEWLAACGLSDVRVERVTAEGPPPTSPVHRASETGVIRSVFGLTE